MVAVILAIVVWGYVIATQYPEETISFTEVPVLILNQQSNNLYASKFSTEAVKVTIFGAKDKVNLVPRSTIQPFIDLKNCTKPGTCDLKVQLRQLPESVSSYTIDPTTVQVQLEEITSKEMEVQINALGTVKLGYNQDKITVNPQVVMVTGPKSLVDRVDKTQVTVNLADRDTSLNGSVAVALLDDQNQPITNKALKVSPETVNVSATINFKLNSKTVPIQVLTVGSPALGYVAASSITVYPNLITLTGDPGDLDKIKYVETEPIDLNNATSDIETTVKLVIPYNTSGGSVTQAQVRIGITEAQASVPVRVEVGVVNPPSLRYQLNPSVITITLEGPYQALQPKLPIDQIKATVDLGGRNEPGTFEVPLQVQTPPGLVATNLPKITATIVAPPRPTATPTLPPPPTSTPNPTATPNPPTSSPAPTTQPPEPANPTPAPAAASTPASRPTENPAPTPTTTRPAASSTTPPASRPTISLTPKGNAPLSSELI